MKKIILITIMLAFTLSVFGGDLDPSAIVDSATTTPEMWTDLYNALTGDSTYDNVSSNVGCKVYRAKVVTYKEGNFYYATVTEIDDDFGFTADTQSIDDGLIQFTKASAFTEDKTYLSWSISDFDDAGNEIFFEIYLKRLSANTIALQYYLEGSTVVPDGELTIFVEIIVHP